MSEADFLAPFVQDEEAELNKKFRALLESHRWTARYFLAAHKHQSFEALAESFTKRFGFNADDAAVLAHAVQEHWLLSELKRGDQGLEEKRLDVEKLRLQVEALRLQNEKEIRLNDLLKEPQTSHSLSAPLVLPQLDMSHFFQDLKLESFSASFPLDEVVSIDRDALERSERIVDAIMSKNALSAHNDTNSFSAPAVLSLSALGEEKSKEIPADVSTMAPSLSAHTDTHTDTPPAATACVVDVETHMRQLMSIVMFDLDGWTLDGTANTPAAAHLFQTSSNARHLNREEERKFRVNVVRLMHLARTARPDLLTAMLFLERRHERLTLDDFKKLQRVVKYLRQTYALPMRILSDGRLHGEEDVVYPSQDLLDRDIDRLTDEEVLAFFLSKPLQGVWFQRLRDRLLGIAPSPSPSSVQAMPDADDELYERYMREEAEMEDWRREREREYRGKYTASHKHGSVSQSLKRVGQQLHTPTRANAHHTHGRGHTAHDAHNNQSHTPNKRDGKVREAAREAFVGLPIAAPEQAQPNTDSSAEKNKTSTAVPEKSAEEKAAALRAQKVLDNWDDDENYDNVAW